MMRKKFVILGLILLLAGTAMIGWVLAERRKRQQSVARYKLKYGSETSDYIKQYDEWLQLPVQERTQLPLVLDEYGKSKTKAQVRQEQQERLTADLDRLAAGETVIDPLAEILYGDNWQNELVEYKKQKELNEFILTGSIVCASMGGSIFAWCLLLWTGRLAGRGLSGSSKFLADAFRNRRQDKDEQPANADEKDSAQQQTQLETHSKVVRDTGRKHPASFVRAAKGAHKVTREDETSSRAEKIALLLSDERFVRSNASAKGGHVRIDVAEHSKPMDNALEELTEQVSAIRQYTAYQQNRLEKLQDGYDWNIIRAFCLRVIRCIDNLQTRVDRLIEQDMDTTQLEEIRDELIFALDSSGVEQFEPKTNSDYRGQEKYAEAVKDRQRSKKPKQTGKIAAVIRPGYQYFINEDNVKVIRPAQVKLFA